jgi:hypothetical protein
MRHTRNQAPKGSKPLRVPQPIFNLLLVLDILLESRAQPVNGLRDSLDFAGVGSRLNLRSQVLLKAPESTLYFANALLQIANDEQRQKDRSQSRGTKADGY